MNPAITSALLSLFRHLLTAVGAGVVIEQHNDQLAQIAGAIVAITPALFGAYKSHRDAKLKQEGNAP